MKPLRILYLGPLSGTCLDRARAYERLGHEVTHVDLRALLPASVWIDRIIWRIGGQVLNPLTRRRLAAHIQGRHFDLCHVDNGELISGELVKWLKQRCAKVINYNIDDPTGPRDMQRFAAYRHALPHYDLAAVVREENVSEAHALGARRVMRVWRSADEVNHAPRRIDAPIARKWSADVLFLGTWMPERGPFLLKLIGLGVPLTVQGDNWHKAPEWPLLRAYWRGPGVSGEDYAHAIQCAKVNLGLLSKGNRDLHTTRSLEIPALGGLLCAERTSEHKQMYEEDAEAVFWADAQECARKCLQLLANEHRRTRIAWEGHRRFLANGHGNEDILRSLLEAAWN